MKRKSLFLGFGIRHWFINDIWRRAFSAIVPRAIAIRFRVRDINNALFNVAPFKTTLRLYFFDFSHYVPPAISVGGCINMSKNARQSNLTMQRYGKFHINKRVLSHNLLIHKQIQENTNPAQVFVQVCIRKQQKREPTIADSLHFRYYKSRLIHLRIPVWFRFVVEPIVVKHHP